MSAPDNPKEHFLRRWSRRKQRAEKHPDAGGKAPQIVADETAAPVSSAQRESDGPVFDPASLPPIDSINAASDIRAFLAPNVPMNLARAALRRAWLTDPNIHDFVGLAENQWDFTNPDSVPGFGSLEITPELQRMAANLIGDLCEPSAQPLTNVDNVKTISADAGQLRPSAMSSAIPSKDTEKRCLPPQPVSEHIDAHAAHRIEGREADSRVPTPRNHGGALPK